MMYLIEHLFWFLALAFAFAGLAGWAWQRLRVQPRLDSAMRERERLMRDLVGIAAESEGGGAGVPAELERQMDALKLRADMAQARVVELDRTAEAARGRAEEAVGRVAELERALDGAGADSEELRRLREESAAQQEESRRTVDVVATPAPDPGAEGQAWRLRYFEQRVRYLESRASASEPAAPSDLQVEWRARLAEARARHLEEELRSAAPASEPAMSHTQAVQAPPVPAATEPALDPLLQWREIYLEKRVQHLREPAPATAAPALAPAADLANEAELAKWRARYLEARVRHLEAQLAAAPAAPIETHEAAPTPQPVTAPAQIVEERPAPPPPLVPAGSEERPAALPAAQSGAPDDLSMIEGVSLLQQSTLNALGIYHFEQIAQWAPANIAWVDQYLRLRGRISQEDWVGQAQALARGEAAIGALQSETV